MSDIPFKVAGTVLKDLAYSQRWAALAAAEVDLATFETWDRHLPRDRRILVPVDVQAFVAPTGGSDPVRRGGRANRRPRALRRRHPPRGRGAPALGHAGRPAAGCHGPDHR